MVGEEKQPEDISEELERSVSPDKETVVDEAYEAEEDYPTGPTLLQRFWVFYVSHKERAIPITAVLFVLAIFVIPFSRYKVFGLFLERDIVVSVRDHETNIPISSVDVRMGSKTVKTNGQGEARFADIAVGKQSISLDKKYYKTAHNTVLVPAFGKNTTFTYQLEATGRQVPVHVANTITGQNIKGATIKTADTEAITDDNGEATIALPADHHDEAATVELKGYNTLSVKLTVSETAVKQNAFELTPSGKVFFLSKQSGKLDVVKTDLDGNSRETVVAGTGNESDQQTNVYQSKDWKYMILMARRETAEAKLYLIESSTGQLTEIDAGEATYTPVGWFGHYFLYTKHRLDVEQWQGQVDKLQSFNAETSQIVTIDETKGEGTGTSEFANEVFSTIFLTKDGVVYTKQWSAGYYSIYRLANKRMGIYTATAAGASKQTLKDFDVGVNGYIQGVQAKPDQLYFSVQNALTSYYTYSDRRLSEQSSQIADKVTVNYPQYVAAPENGRILYMEQRDGQNTLLVTDQKLESPKVIVQTGHYVPYAWFTGDYILVTQNKNELYIMPATGLIQAARVVKIADIHSSR